MPSTWDRALFLTRGFLYLLAGALLLTALLVIAYAVLAPLLTVAGAHRARRILTGYLVAAPLVLYNLVGVAGLFAIQFVAVQWIYNSVANPQTVFDRAFHHAGGAAPHTAQYEIIDRIKRSAGLGTSGLAAPMEGLTHAMWAVTGAFGWIILLSLLAAMVRDLAVTSWSFLAAPVQREVHGRPWGELIRRAVARFIHVLLYTFMSSAYFLAAAVFVLVAGWASLRMLAGLLVTYLAAIQTASGGVLPFLLLASFYVCMLEALAVFFVSTSLAAFVASRSISLQIEDALALHLKLDPVPPPACPPKPASDSEELGRQRGVPRLVAPTLAAGRLLAKLVAAVAPVWLVMGFVVAPLLPIGLSAPLGVLLHLAGFNVVLWLLKAHRDLKPLFVDAWAGVPKLR